ncbi:MAG TPA: ATP-binding protein [Chitinivibrionales bacterium]|nr:ATP-binding protein [Chitinivibrionales bacterium]
MNFLLRLVRTRLNPFVVLVAIGVVYFAVQSFFLLVVNDDATLSIAAVPILFSGWFMGPWWAVGAGACIFVYFFLIKFFSMGFSAWVDMAVGGGSIAIFALIGAAIGRMEQLNRLLQEQLAARKIAEQALESRTQQLARSNKELEQFAYIASHDLQEPLRKISAFGSRLASKYTALIDDQGKDYLARMQNAAVRMQGLIEGLLTYSRVTTKAQPFSPVDLFAILTEVLGDLETKIKDTGADVRCDVSATIDADPLQMRQLFQNLVGNALKYHAPGVSPVIDIRASTADGRCSLTVTDNGIGFEQKYAEQIFGVFQRLHGRSSEYEGSGIGLSVCRKIAERHGGTISAQSEPGKGATFTVMLPAKQA